jgi:putative lipoprotein
MQALQQMRGPFVACLIAFLASACTNAPMNNDAEITGTATYRERMALPAGAIFEATLEDISRADAAARVIGSTRVQSPAAPPIEFSISYDPQQIEATHRYAVRARILHEDRLMFTTDTVHHVLTQGAPTNVELLLKRAASSDTSGTASLENTYWKVVSIRGAPVVVTENQREPHLLLHPEDRRVTGHGGCNALTGSYEISTDRITFGQMAATMMACMNGMEQEQALHKTLRGVVRWKISGERLELLDAQGMTLIELESRYLR